MRSDPICSSAGCTGHRDRALGYPIDYPVPQLGQDGHIVDNHQSLAWAEKALGHKWEWKKADPKPDEVLYKTDGPMDGDIVDSLAALGDQERIHGDWKIPKDDHLVQMQAGSDPVCSSAGCTQYLHPAKKLGYAADYVVPNFGADHDMVSTEAHTAAAEARLGHQWTPTKDEDDKWVLPSATADFRLTP